MSPGAPFTGFSDTEKALFTICREDWGEWDINVFVWNAVETGASGINIIKHCSLIYLSGMPSKRGRAGSISLKIIPINVFVWNAV